MYIIRFIPAIILCLVSCHAAMGQKLGREHREWFENITIEDSPYTVAFPDTLSAFELEVCGAMKGLRDTRGNNKQSWSVDLMQDDSCLVSIQVGWGNSEFGAITDNRYLELSAVSGWTERFTDGVSVYDNDNALVISSSERGVATVSIGNDLQQYAGTVKWGDAVVTSAVVRANGRLSAPYISLYARTQPDLDSKLSLEEIYYAATGSDIDRVTGIWTQLDRDTENAFARPGGNYTIAIIPCADSEQKYLIVYLDGAVVNSSQWKTGMIKGWLSTVYNDNTFSLDWVSAYLENASPECNATLDADGILTLNFPLLKSQLRFTRK